MGSLLQNFEGYISAFENQLFNHSFIPLSPPLCEGKGKDFPKMGYKRRDVKQSIKEECQKEVAQKGKWEFFVCRKR